MSAPEQATAALEELLRSLAQALHAQREVLEAGRLHDLADVNAALEQGYARFEGWPGGPAALMAQLAELPEEDHRRLRGFIESAATDNRICGDLIRLALQRAAAMQALQAAASDAGTYGPDARQSAGTRLSHRA